MLVTLFSDSFKEEKKALVGEPTSGVGNQYSIGPFVKKYVYFVRPRGATCRPGGFKSETIYKCMILTDHE